MHICICKLHTAHWHYGVHYIVSLLPFISRESLDYGYSNREFKTQ